MAKSKLSYYNFTPGAAGAGRVKIPQQIHLSDVLLITNTTVGDILYNFSDPTRGATLAYTPSAPILITAASGTGTTATLTFAAQGNPPFYVGQSITVSGCAPVGYNATATVTACTTTTVSYANATTGALTINGTVTSTEPATLFPGFLEGMTTLTLEKDSSAAVGGTTPTASDKILIYVDEKKDSVKIAPIESLNDPVEKFRVSQPQSLIDTDYEYSTQPSKWESVGLVQNYPSYFARSGGNSINVSSATGSATTPFTVTIVTASAHGFAVGDIVLVRELTGGNAQNAEGMFAILSVPNSTTFTYAGKATTASISSNAYTVVYGGGKFDNSNIPKSGTFTSSGNITLATTAASSTGGIATLTFDSQTQPPFYIGQSITVSGVTPAGFNGTFTVTGSTPTSVSYSNGTAGPQTVAGSITSSSSVVTVSTSTAHGLFPTSPVEIAAFSGAVSATRVAASAGRGYNANTTISGVTFTSATNAPGTKGQVLISTDANGTVSTIQLMNTGTGYTNAAQLTDCILDVGSGSPALTLSTLTVTNRASSTTTRTLTTSATHNLAAGNYVTISGINANYDGTFVVATVPTGTTFTYTAASFTEASIASGGTVVNICRFTVDTEANVATKIMNGGRIVLSVETPTTFKMLAGGRLGDLTSRVINVTGASGTGTTATITFSTQPVAPFTVGQSIVVAGINPSGYNGTATVTAVTTTSVSYANVTTAAYVAAGTITPSQASTSVNSSALTLLAKSDGYVAHRAQDGGCIISTSLNLIGVQQIRQTRRYFRYQSGKGIQMSTGIKFTPTLTVRDISASGTTCTVTTIEDHGLQPGARVLIEGVEVGSGTNTYNGTFAVLNVTSEKVFTYTMTATPTDTSPGGSAINVTTTNWNGAFVRVGLFDFQNGMFFEYDGQQLFAVRRQTIQELLGTITANAGSAAVSGNSTRFLKQLTPGDFIVIKGSTYLVNRVTSNTALEISPVFRGSLNATNSRYQRTVDTRIPQSQWNIDRMDGTGPSGYTLDTRRMQMAYIDYSWYGAGYIRYGFRSSNGQVSYCHKILNNNVNLQAYMRSGNLPARYEVMNFGYYSKLIGGATGTRGSALTGGDTTLHVVDATYWPTSGTVFIEDANNCEIVTYTGKSQSAIGWALTGLTRRTFATLINFPVNNGLYGTSSAVTFTPAPLEGGAGTSAVSVTLLNQTCAPTVSHWGTSVIMDGLYDVDKEYEFTAGMRTKLSIAQNTTKPLISIRIAPSADNGIGRNFGVREIVNRMQLMLKSVGVNCTGQFLISGVFNPTLTLNGQTFPTAWELPANATGAPGSLAQAIFHNINETVSGGEPVFSFYANNSGGTTNFTVTTKELSSVRELGTSILSGNGSPTTPGYPNAPDILTIVAQNLSTTTAADIFARVSWTEAQA